MSGNVHVGLCEEGRRLNSNILTNHSNDASEKHPELCHWIGEDTNNCRLHVPSIDVQSCVLCMSGCYE